MAAKTPRAKTPAADPSGNDQQDNGQNNAQVSETAGAAVVKIGDQPTPIDGAGGEQSTGTQEPEPASELTTELPAPAGPVPSEPETALVATEPASPLADLLGGAVGDFIREAAHCVIEERVRQIVEEGHSPDDDAAYSKYQLERAAVGYVGHAAGLPRARLDLYWPFHPSSFKPGATRRQTLVKAGALILAAIEAIDRTEATDN